MAKSQNLGRRFQEAYLDPQDRTVLGVRRKDRNPKNIYYKPNKYGADLVYWYCICTHIQRPDAHAYAHTRTHTHTHAHKCTCARAHLLHVQQIRLSSCILTLCMYTHTTLACALTHAHRNLLPHTLTRIHTRTCTHIHTHTLTHALSLSHTRKHTHTLSQAHARAHALARVLFHAYII